jgi:multiple sugar transport system substrate-binding protein
VCDDGDSWSILGSFLDFSAQASESDGREHLTAAAEQRSTSWGDFMPRSTPRRSPAPSQFPNSSVNQFSRRQLLAGAGAALGTGAVLAGLGSSSVSALSQASPQRWPRSSGEPVTFGSNWSDPVPKEGMAAALESTGIPVTINTVDHNTYQQNFNTYLQQPDDVFGWFAGYRMRAFADKGVLGDISDVWATFDGFADPFKDASTGRDGKQYFVPFYFYPWGINYRKSVFADAGYEIPVTWDEFKALLDQMQADGIETPLAAANSGNWPQMGMFDMLNLRINGYDYHISLMGGQEDWTSDQVKEVFATWEELLPYYQPDGNGRTWQDAATDWANGVSGMYLLGTFVASNFDPDTQQDIIEDIDFFAFPALNDEYGQDSVEAPIDGFLMAPEPDNEEGAKALLTALGGPEAIDAFLAIEGSSVAANSNADTSAYSALQQKSVEFVGAATHIAQFLDRDTEPDFAANVVGAALADFIADPSQIDSILSTVEEQKSTYTFE